ncbi:granzyme F-like [Aphidius gifuensis]|uniref:granzyme F-like n=1 Tax=Aphidius gifuensis TaxID=684658 RepID=UPI001CDB4B25|nr:granzyme F-like [Aphidius gifuensis]
MNILIIIFSLFSLFVGTKQEIKHGDIVAAREIPYQVYLRINTIYSCGGTILDELHILTSASCVHKNDIYPLDLSEIEVLVGTNSTNSKNDFMDIYRVHKINIHNDFVPSNKTTKSFLADICILTLSRYITFSEFVKPIKLPNDYDIINTNHILTVGSFGPVDYERFVPSYRIRVSQVVINNIECLGFWYKYTLVTPDIMDERLCARPLPGHSACSVSHLHQYILFFILFNLFIFSFRPIMEMDLLIMTQSLLFMFLVVVVV